MVFQIFKTAIFGFSCGSRSLIFQPLQLCCDRIEPVSIQSFQSIRDIDFFSLRFSDGFVDVKWIQHAFDLFDPDPVEA